MNVREATRSTSATSATLGSLVDALGEGLVRVITAPRGLDVPVIEVVVHDSLTEPTPGRDDLLLAVGVDPHRASAVDVVTACGARGAAAVLLKDDRELPLALVAAAEGAGVALLLAPAAAAWGPLHTLMRTARSVSPPRDPGREGAPLGDLFALADALASAVGGAVSIEDERSAVLAYSTGPHPTDDARRAAILGRRVPSAWVERLQEMGVFRTIVSSDEIVHVEPLDDLAYAPRLVIGVRAGGEALGSIWVQQGDRPFGADAEQALREATSLAALHLLRARSGEDLERRRSGDQLRSVLGGRLPANLLADALQVRPHSPVILLGLELADPESADADVLADRLADFLVFSCAAFRRRVVAAGVGRTAFAVLAGRAGGPDEARSLAADLAGRASTGLQVDVRAAVAHSAVGLSALVSLRAEVGLALRVQANRNAIGPVHVDDIRSATILVQLSDIAAERPGLLAGKVQLLEASDRDRSTTYVDTLRAFLDAFGDVRLAAQAVGVHPNTFRYRLRRLSELVQLDLNDPEQRLVAALQLRLIAPTTMPIPVETRP
ncbi:MAG: putative transcriptional regulator, PucR family [Frankiales bacterium]|nr:putative transcriptional regulator, PucR family [Frankiales bacterium]